mgnify:CR=1 FL=1
MEDSTSGDGQRPPETGGVAAGTILKDRYRVERELGRGGIGVVFLARDQLLHDRPVVVKLLLGTVGDTAWVLRKFQHEIAALARIDHPGVVGALDVGELDNRTPYIVMQFVEGRSLRAVAVDGALAFDRIGRLMRMIGQALSALAFARFPFVPPLRWVYGDDAGNLERMIAASVKAMDNAFPSSKLVSYDPDNRRYLVGTIASAAWPRHVPTSIRRRESARGTPRADPCSWPKPRRPAPPPGGCRTAGRPA